MDTLAIASLVVILASIAIPLAKKLSFCVTAIAACIIIYGMEVAADSMGPIDFTGGDLVDPARFYTILTSMYAHASIDHLLFNILGLAFIGIILEQRIGTRPFLLLYILSGIFGSLAFAAYYLNGPVAYAVGASGAVSGVLGGLARLYPNEKMVFLFFPTYPLRIPYIVMLFVAFQFIFVFFGNIAWQAHLGGLVAGILLAPLVLKARAKTPLKREISVVGLRKLATTPELRSILGRIEQETVPDVRKAWIEHFLAKARCPICGSPIRVSGDLVKCSRGHIL